MHIGPHFERLCAELSGVAHQYRSLDDWPSASLSRCGEAGVFYGLSGSSEPSHPSAQTLNAQQQIHVWTELAKADLVTTFIVTQHLGAIKRILGSDRLQDESVDSIALKHIADSLLRGDRMGSVGISHLTTSRRHINAPAVAAVKVDDGYVVDGTIPWVTGARHVEHLVVGAVIDEDNELLVLMDTDQPGVSRGPGAEMIAMTASCTDAVTLDQVFVPQSRVLSGPRSNVLTALPSDSQSNVKPSGGAGGLQTSALALGLSLAAVNFLREESSRRDHLRPIVQQFDRECETLSSQLDAMASGQTDVSNADVRAAVNSLTMRVTSAAMTTAKGAGLMVDHPVARWCQQAFFFLVWSCPAPVAQAHLCELAGFES